MNTTRFSPAAAGASFTSLSAERTLPAAAVAEATPGVLVVAGPRGARSITTP